MLHAAQFCIQGGIPADFSSITALAYRTCCILNYNQLLDSSYALTNTLAVDHEFKRRCLWACWASHCVALEPRAYATSAWSEVANLPLPSLLLGNRVKLDIVAGQRMDMNWRCSNCNHTCTAEDKGSIWAEIMKIVGVWYVPICLA